jgi:hypothetical protein
VARQHFYRLLNKNISNFNSRSKNSYSLFTISDFSDFLKWRGIPQTINRIVLLDSGNESAMPKWQGGTVTQIEKKAALDVSAALENFARMTIKKFSVEVITCDHIPRDSYGFFIRHCEVIAKEISKVDERHHHFCKLRMVKHQQFHYNCNFNRL